MNSDIAQPLVTVIVPTIGRPCYIPFTIQSILSQTYSNIEILISDNLPSQKTADILSEAGISDTRIFFLERNKRLNFCEHMNVCIRDAHGFYIMILSDDDQITPTYVEEMVALIEGNDGVSVCLGRQLKISEHDHGLLANKISESPQIIIDGIQFLNKSLSGKIQIEVMTYLSMFARKKEIKNLGGLKHYPYGAHSDNFLLIQLALKGNVAIGQSIMFYRVYEKSLGLSMPFAALVNATYEYTYDCFKLFANKEGLDQADRVNILRAIKINNYSLILVRFRSIYLKKLSIIKIIEAIYFIFKFKLKLKDLN